MAKHKPNPTCMRNLLEDALDLVPRISEEDPMARALADWCRRVRNTLTGQTDLDNLAAARTCRASAALHREMAATATDPQSKNDYRAEARRLEERAAMLEQGAKH